MMPTNLSDEQAVNTTLQFCMLGVTSAARFLRYVLPKFKAGKVEDLADLTLISDACSFYRGGTVSADTPEVRSMISDLSGVLPEELNGEFFFIGNRSDLSYFWRKGEDGQALPLYKEMIEKAVTNEDLKKSVIAGMTKARLDGLITDHGDHYRLTECGYKAIHRTDFITNRLKGELERLGLVSSVLVADREKTINDRIDRKLRELGLEHRYDGCDRVTINKEKLVFLENEKSIDTYVPGTKHSKTVEFAKSDLIELDERTYAVFLDPARQYRVGGDGGQQLYGEKELFAYYDNKNKEKRMIDQIQKGKLPDQIHQIPEDRSGNWFVLDRNGEPAEYTVTRLWQTDEGAHFNLRSVDGKNGDLLLPDEAFGVTAFRNREIGSVYWREHQAEVMQMQNAIGFADAADPIEITVLPRNYIQADDSYRIAIQGGRLQPGGEYVEIPATQVVKQADGSIRINLIDQNYTATTGQYRYTLSPNGVKDLAVVQKGATVATTAQVGNVVKTTVNAVPAVDGVSAAAKVVMNVSTKVAEGISSSAGLTLKQ